MNASRPHVEAAGAGGKGHAARLERIARNGRVVLKRALTVVQRWKARIVFATLDQGFTSAANFLLTIQYATWMPLDAFGRYVLIWTISLFIENIQIAVMLDVLPALASRFARSGRRRIDAAGLWVALAYGGVTSILLLTSVPIVSPWSDEFAVALLCLAAINPVQRLGLYFRRLSYIRDRTDAAATGAFVYCLVMLTGAFVLHRLDLLTVPNVLVLWGVGNAVATGAMCVKAGLGLRASRPVDVVWLAGRLWRSGRWLVAAAACYWISQWGMFPLAAVAGGPDAAGILRAMQNLFTPIIQFNAVLGLVLLPRVADNVAGRREGYARSFALYGTAVFGGIVALYSAVVLVASPQLVGFLYHKAEIIGAVGLLWPLAAAVVFDSARQGASMALLAENRTRVAFMSRIAGVLLFFAAAAMLVPPLGIAGILWANAAANALGAAWLLTAVLSAGSGARRFAAPGPM